MLDSVGSKFDKLNIKTLKPSKIKEIENEVIRESNLTVLGQEVRLHKEGKYEYVSQMRWKSMLTDYIALRVLIRMYRLLIKIKEDGNNVEEPVYKYSEDVREGIEVLEKNISQIGSIYKRKTIKDSRERERMVRKSLSFLLLKKSAGLAGDGIPNEVYKNEGESQYHIVTGLENLGLKECDNADIVTTYTKKQLLELSYTSVSIDWGGRTVGEEIRLYSEVYKDMFGKQIGEVFGGTGSGDKLVLNLSNSVDELEELLKHRLLSGDARGLLGTLVSKIKKKSERKKDNAEDEMYKLLKEYGEREVESGYTLSEVLDSFKNDVFGLEQEVVKLETKNVESKKEDKVQESSNNEEEGKELKEEIEHVTTKEEVKSQESVKEDIEESEEVQELNGELNFKAIDKFYKLLERIDERSPSKKMYSLLKKGGLKEEVIVDFMKCKNINYYDYLEIESVLDKEFGDKEE